MKRKVIILLLLICIIFTSCIPTSKDPTNIQNVEVLTSGTFNYATPMSVSTQGVYSVVETAFSKNICFSDFNYQKTTYLCSDLACEHLDDTCTSYLPVSGFLFIFNEQLYYLSNNVATSGYKQLLCSMNLDGSNKKIIRELTDSNLYNGSHICGAGNYLYVILYENDVPFLRRIDVTSGSIINLTYVSDSTYIISAYGPNIYLKKSVDYDFNKYMFSPQFEVIAFDTLAETSSVIYTSDILENQIVKYGDKELFIPINDTIYFFKQNMMYYLSKNNNILYRLDLLDNTEIKISDLSVLNLDWNDSTIEEVEDDLIIIKSLEPTRRYILDIKNDNIIESKLQSYSSRSQEERSLDPIAIVDDKILFYHNGISYTKTFNLPDGTIEQSLLSIPTLHYISTTDYLNNNPVYTSMEFIDLNNN